MTQPFNAIALEYDSLWTETPTGRHQRLAVWKEIDQVFTPGSRILDLGCGTGVDAVHLQERGVDVTAIDSAPAMVAAACSHGVNAQCLAIEAVGNLPATFDGALSNFGALNCVRDLHAVALHLSRLIRPHGTLALCLMGRICWPEILCGLALGDWQKASRRWRGTFTWRGIEVFYPTRAAVRAAFEPDFVLQRIRSLAGGDHWLSLWTRRP